MLSKQILFNFKSQMWGLRILIAYTLASPSALCTILKLTTMQLLKLLFGEKALWTNSIFFLRVWVGAIFVRYGLSLFYNNNMFDFADTLKTIHIPFPNFSAFVCKATEFFGGLFLIVGFLKRTSCFFLIIDMAVATFVFHKGLLLQNGMTTFLLLICCLTILISATDNLSVDWLILKYKLKK